MMKVALIHNLKKHISIFNMTILFSQMGYFPLAYVREDEDE
jgi:hypothetical protein